ncbi:TlpA family protein disulfide reductase [Belliella sp. R4-6]|uniref:TlpA family protein disulfide reductase n=1 Tax=Belliella alkalica TaxID=1730871 RepID=A0ABS9VDT5_9BACT|nr:TlpA disulfide reductase family protein [Belliella alkalica]MCH7414053.1 TlpA family protein disulfide reductase [Belliella alkalica]
MNTQLNRLKITLFLFLGVFFSLSVNAQDYSESYVNYMSDLEKYVKDDLYGKVSSVLYDVEEAPLQEDYLSFVKEIQKEINKFYTDRSADLSLEERMEVTSFKHTMLVQLGELYLDRSQEMAVEERLEFFKKYLSETSLQHSIENLTDDLARSIMMALHSALKVPFGISNSSVSDYIFELPKEERELLWGSYILNDVLMLTRSYEEIEETLKDFKSTYPQSGYIQNMDEGLASMEKLKTGALVEDFQFANLEGEAVKLSDYEDKIIYLDLWASWCGPCINTFRTKTPDFEKALREYEDIVLMYISVDDQPDPWKNYLDKNQMRGVHLYAGKGFEAEIMKYFKVWGIPRYLIIGKGNKLVNVNAPRPGEEAIEELINLRGI